MENEGLTKGLIGLIGTGVLGLYGLFIRHISRHANRETVAKLWDKKQDKTTCQQIVKRLDDNHQETCKKLDRILDLVGKADG